jgi:DNA-binding response OmpR family regulator
MTQITILVAEDDPHIRMGLKDTLESEGYRVVEAQTGGQAKARFQAGGIDLILLDVMMPEKSGYDVCRDIRAAGDRVPIIMLTAKGEEIDKVVGLQLGADDYVTMPFGVHELLARIDAVLRRTVRAGNPEKTGDPPFSFGPFEVNPKTYQVTVGGVSRDLTDRELTLIRCFHAYSGEVLSRDFLLNAGWGIDYLGTTRTLDQHIAKLRKKIETDPSHPRLITTVHGLGYRYNAG